MVPQPDLASRRPEPVSYALRVGIPLPLAMCFVAGLVFMTLGWGLPS